MSTFIGRASLAGYRTLKRLRDRVFTWTCGGAFHGVGKGSLLELPIRLAGEAHIEIGADVFIGSHSWLQVLSSGEPRQAPVIAIGDGSSIAGCCTVTAMQSVVIEPRVLMARNVYISDHIHAHESGEVAILDQGIARVAPVRICEGAWLGQGVVICPGVTVGKNAVVGANSVVRDDIPDHCVAAGAPAKVIRRTQVDPQHVGAVSSSSPRH